MKTGHIIGQIFTYIKYYSIISFIVVKKMAKKFRCHV